MKTVRTVVLIGVLIVLGALPVIGQVHKFFSPGTVWTVTMIKMASGMDQSYLQYLDGEFKKAEEAQIKAGFQKSYKILRTMDDGGAWNLLILREYTSLANIETNKRRPMHSASRRVAMTKLRCRAIRTAASTARSSAPSTRAN